MLYQKKINETWSKILRNDKLAPQQGSFIENQLRVAAYYRVGVVMTFSGFLIWVQIHFLNYLKHISRCGIL